MMLALEAEPTDGAAALSETRLVSAFRPLWLGGGGAMMNEAAAFLPTE
jgi:hypothetical protein